MIYIPALILSIPAGVAVWLASQNRLLLAALFGLMGGIVCLRARKEVP